MANHPIVHVEIPANDPQAAGKFYSDLFGWKTEFMASMDYMLFDTGNGMGGGIPRVDGQMTKPGDVLVYVETDDIEASLAKAESLGGTALVHKTEIPGQGWFGIFKDPTGNRVALFTGMPGA